MESNSVWPKFGHTLLVFYFCQSRNIKHVYDIKKYIFFHSIKMSSAKEIKNLKLIKIMREFIFIIIFCSI